MPKFRIATKGESDITPGYAVVLSVSVREKDIRRDSLVALACKLRRDFEAFKVIQVFLFNDHKDAKLYAPCGDVENPETPVRPRAKIVFVEEGSESFLEWFPTEDAHKSGKDAIRVRLSDRKSPQAH